MNREPTKLKEFQKMRIRWKYKQKNDKTKVHENYTHIFTIIIYTYFKLILGKNTIFYCYYSNFYPKLYK